MATLLDGVGTYAKELKTLTGRQADFLDVPGADNAKDLSVVSFKAVERMGEQYRILIKLTHPDGLTRGGYLAAMLIGLAILMGSWGLLDWLYADRVRFKRRRARGPDA
ncbi:hypothetical protein R75461_07193 [Paraburkholderia nemoris]|uniref:hypothetical protein n=1 Tax=Paraburkholderia nemoris TaxID=2793076 RepID=UPI001909CEB7|nr:MULTISPECIES: hypothetical protein [Paraburkholderia]CAE6844745.1 hypothetical protein R75461_07193 [Paraburkholderia nemoris]